MRLLVRTEIGLVAVMAVSVLVTHDRLHRESGEESHVVWGRGDRRKPPWWPIG